MSRNRTKQDGVQSTVYDPFNHGNTAMSRKSLMERMYIRVLTELSCNRFKWVGLPDTIDERFIELTLFRQSLAVFYFDEQYHRHLCLRAAGTGRVNMYDNPTTFTVIGNAMVHKTLNARKCVPIWSNYLRIPDWDIVMIYATKLAEIDRTIEIDLKAMRYNYILQVPENERLTYENIMRQHDEGQPIVFGTQALDPDAVIKTFPILIDKDVVLNLQMSKTKLWNEVMTLLGINNSNQDKKERLVADEVSANDGQVVASRNVSLNARQHAAEQINKMYDLHISVQWNMSDAAVPTMPGDLT